MKRRFTASVFIRHNQKILLVNHKKLNAYLPVGGKMEENETPLECATREVWEETGMTNLRFPKLPAPYGTPPGFLGFEEHRGPANDIHMNFAFFADSDTDVVEGDGSFTDHKWVGVEDMLSLTLNQNVRDFLTKIFTEIDYLVKQ